MNECETLDNSCESQEDYTAELENLRNKQRREKLADRQYQRKFLLKKFRLIQDNKTEKIISENNLTSLAKAIKIKSQVSCELLNAVMNALLNGEGCIKEFLSVDGALQALLRALSGQNESYQLIAARCICNLALGNKKQSYQVLKSSESYLMVHLSGKNYYIKEPCAIALGNFSRHGEEHIELLQKQGFFPKIINLLQDSNSHVRESAVYALNQIVYHGFDIVEEEHLKNTLHAILPIFTSTCSPSTVFLVFLLLSSKKYFHDFFSILYTHKVHIVALEGLKNCLAEEKKECLNYLRILTNCISEESGQMARELIECDAFNLKKCVNYLLQSNQEYLRKECLSLIGNLLNHPCCVFVSIAKELINENYSLIQTSVNNLKMLSDDQL